jgi:hypothetical protein
MPGFYPSQLESVDNAADADIRARARRLADDIEALHGTLDPSAASRPHARALLAWLAERLPYAARALRAAADKYPGPHPRPFQYYVAVLESADRAFLDEQVVVLKLGGIGVRLDQLNRDWPCFDGMVLRQLRVEAGAGKPGAAALLKFTQAAGNVSEGSFV